MGLAATKSQGREKVDLTGGDVEQRVGVGTCFVAGMSISPAVDGNEILAKNIDGDDGEKDLSGVDGFL